MDMLSQIARTVLYEGYILWPYRKTSIKNQHRWTFGGVYPRAFAAMSGGSDRACVRSECLVEAQPGARLRIDIRFLQIVARQVMAEREGQLVPVDELTVGPDRLLSWDEATERTYTGTIELPDGSASRTIPMTIVGAQVTETLQTPDGTRVGALIRRWESIAAEMAISAVWCAPGLYRVGVVVTNTTPWNGHTRADALRQTLASMHAVFRIDQGSFVSLTDPPVTLLQDTAACSNDGLWPVLVGEDGARDTILASPIILSDYPQIAPESPGDMFDGGEIDQLLVLNVLTLSQEEQQEMRDSDPRAREILDRCTCMSSDDIMRLHGTIRSMRPLTEA
jgi:hydrogenase maturation protease